MEDWTSQLQVQAEDEPTGANQIHNARQIGERVKSLQANHDLARSAGDELEHATQVMGAGVHQKRAGETGLELGQLSNERALNRPTLDRIQVGDIADIGAEYLKKGVQQRDRIPSPLRRQNRLDRLVSQPIARLGVDRHPPGNVEHRNDLHGGILFISVVR
jgi:hypothetical protein